jgi:hypothetical protein
LLKQHQAHCYHLNWSLSHSNFPKTSVSPIFVLPVFPFIPNTHHLTLLFVVG